MPLKFAEMQKKYLNEGYRLNISSTFHSLDCLDTFSGVLILLFGDRQTFIQITKKLFTSNWRYHFNFQTVTQFVRQHYTFLLLWHICVPGSVQRSLFQKNGAALTAALRFDAISCDSSPADGLVKCQLAAIHLHIVLSYAGSGANRSFYLWSSPGWWLSLSPRCPSGACSYTYKLC